MPRHSMRDKLSSQIEDYLADCEKEPYNSTLYEIRAVAKKLHVSPTTIYTYQFQDMIREAAENRQVENHSKRRRKEKDQVVSELRNALAKSEERNRQLVNQLTLIEINAAMMGINAEDLYRLDPKPSKL